RSPQVPGPRDQGWTKDHGQGTDPGPRTDQAPSPTNQGPLMRRILVTNDDGYRSEGIIALADALRPLGDVTIVAPMSEASAIGHALTLRRPLRLEHISDKVFAVDGTPTDCV